MAKHDYIMHRFESIGEFVKAAVKGADKDGGSSHAKPGWDSDWSGAPTFQHAVDWATKGGWEPAEMLEFRNLFDGLEPRLRKFVETSFERGIDQAGFEVNMQAFLDGEPDHMFQWVPAEHQVTKRALCLLIGHSISGGCSAEDLFVRGQAAIALVRALSLLGFELEIWSEQTVRGGGNKRLSVLTRLHAAGAVMDEGALEFAVGNPAWLRRLIFGLEEGSSDAIRRDFGFKKMGGYGGPDGCHHAELVGADVTLQLGQTWFSNYGTPQVRAEAGMEWVVEQLKALGVVDADAKWDD